MGGVSHMEETIKAHKILVCMWEGMILLSTPRCRWEYNVTINLTGQGVDWVHLTPKWRRCLTVRDMAMSVKVLLKRGISLLTKISCFLRNTLQDRVSLIVVNWLGEVAKVVNFMCFDIF
jgi:hypothetical protein